MLFFRNKDNDTVKRKYGDIKSSIFHYISLKMLTLIALISFATFAAWEDIVHNFVSGHVALNGLILFTFFAGMIQATFNNYKLYKVGHYFLDLGYFIDAEGVPSEDEMKQLRNRLERGAALINILTTAKLLDNLEKYGNLLIKDPDARMIKSKMGYRVRSDRNAVTFLTGILVMFGLIGTFWGLLETIGAVADALGKIASSSSGDVGAADMDMGGILAAITGPLEGMGLAFSASLFGLSGSLLLGVYAQFCGEAQSGNIEDFSRWIDDRIPVPDAEKSLKGDAIKDKKGEASVGKDMAELTKWLSTYVYLADDTAKGIRGMESSLEACSNRFGKVADHIEALEKIQRQTLGVVTESNERDASLKDRYDEMGDNLKNVSGSLEEFGGHFKTISRHTGQINDTALQIRNHHFNVGSSQHEKLDKISQMHMEQGEKTFAFFSESVEKLEGNQAEISDEIKAFSSEAREHHSKVIGVMTTFVRQVTDLAKFFRSNVWKILEAVDKTEKSDKNEKD